MTQNPLDAYLQEINKAYGRGDSTEHTHRPALKTLVETLGKKVTATNEPKRIACGAPDFVISRLNRRTEEPFGYIECKDIGINLAKEAKSNQLKRYFEGLHTLILTDYIEFRLFIDGELQESAILAHEGKGGLFTAAPDGQTQLQNLFAAFFAAEPVRVSSSQELAEKMAGIARLLRDMIAATFEKEKEQGKLHAQYEAFKKVLLHDLRESEFADMYAQTICYGLFAARCHLNDQTIWGQDDYAAFHGVDGKSGQFTRKEAAYLLPKTNPFLRNIFGDIAGPGMDDRIAWLVDDLAGLLNNARMDKVLQGFGHSTKRTDPVVHFYETFLGKYDPKMREARGVYYTPEPVVSYIVRSVDHLLRTKFGLKKGLADEKKIRVPVKTHTAAGKQTTSEKNCHRVLVLDPAAGTGTFLQEVIRQIHGKFRDKGKWAGYVREHLLPRLFGFELMMAPYTICHMKLGLELRADGYDMQGDERLGVYLTNTLEEAEEMSGLPLFSQWLADEAREANKVKRDMPIMVVLGNPPYSGLSANMNDWIDRLLKNKLPGENGAPSYYEIDGQPLGEKKVWLQDDYVKFLRYGQYRIEQTGEGVLAFISNHGYLDNPTFRGMRQSLMGTFDEIYILNLHGNTKKREVCPDGSADINVFDIQQGVSIGIFLKQSSNEKPCKVYHTDIYGQRQSKYDWLLKNEIKTTTWTELSPDSPFYFFIKRDETDRKEYEKYNSIVDIFPVNVTGIVTARDKFVIDFDEKVLLERMGEFRDLSLSDGDIRNKYFTGKGSSKYLSGDSRGWKLADARKIVAQDNEWQEKVKSMHYRPFDVRKVYYTDWMVDWPRPDVMYHLLAGNNLALITSRMTKGETFKHAQITRNIIEVICMSPKTSNNGFVFPLYLYQKEEVKGTQKEFLESSHWDYSEKGRVPNLDKAFVDDLAERIKLKFISDGTGDLKKTFGPEDILAYIYGVFHAPSYRLRYAEFLKIDFPRVPLPSDGALFVKLCRLGRELMALHLLEADSLDDETLWPRFPAEGSGLVEKGCPKYVAAADAPEKARVYINPDQYFAGIRPDVWNFHVGGYQVCEKWLKDRRDRQLSYEDIVHYQKVTAALAQTIRLMAEIDAAIAAAGNWPDAFQEKK